MLVFDTQVVHFLAAPVVCFPPALDRAFGIDRKHLSSSLSTSRSPG